jgi:ribosomal-protein-alanine N-acetyltransferase
MTLDDLDQVMEIEHLAFSAAWPASAYRFEISENAQSTLLVVRSAIDRLGPLAGPLRRLGLVKRPPVLGYGGFWLLVDEAHICTLAVHPEWRGQRLGQLLLLRLLEEGGRLGACRATLEVRVSNSAALGLYHKCGFQVVSLQKRYYADNQEDAFIMATPTFNTDAHRTALSGLWAELVAGSGGTQVEATARLQESG